MCKLPYASEPEKIHVLKNYDTLMSYQGYNHVLNNAHAINGISAGQLLTIPSDGRAQLLDQPPAKNFIESILQKQREEKLPQVVSGPYDPSNVLGGASYYDEIRNSKLLASGAQIREFQKVILDPDRLNSN